MGLFGGLGQIAFTAALKHAPVSVVMPMDYSSLIWATLYGWRDVRRAADAVDLDRRAGDHRERAVHRLARAGRAAAQITRQAISE